MKSLIVIPARLESKRFPRKLLKLGKDGKTVLEHTSYNAMIGAGDTTDITIATDSKEIESIVCKWDYGDYCFDCVITGLHDCGTDRVAEAWLLKDPNMKKYDIIVNLQADEVELSGRYISAFLHQAANVLGDDNIATLAAPLYGRLEHECVNVVKVVLTKKQPQTALYFSRNPICLVDIAWKHIGIYAFRPQALLKFVALGQSTKHQLADAERLEQLRALEAGMEICVITIDRPSYTIGRWPIAINSEQDWQDWQKR